MDEYEAGQLIGSAVRVAINDLRYELGDRINQLEVALDEVRRDLAEERNARRIGDEERGTI